MKSFITTLFITILTVSKLFAQEKNQSYLDVALAGGSSFSPAISYNKLWAVSKNTKFKIGTGLRLTALFGSNIDYITAPARLTSGQTSPQVLFSETILTNLDTLSLSQTAVYYVNIPIHLQYSFTNRFEVGFNIDAIGLSLGSKQSGIFKAKESASFNQSKQTASPTTFNLLLISDNDLGNLNSELYARYWLNDKIGLRAGLSFQFSEYTTTNTLTFENNRFRSKQLLPMLAISYRL
ncbi:MAG: hypothetical protein ACOVOQ_15875 [Flavobacterium sp.]